MVGIRPVLPPVGSVEIEPVQLQERGDKCGRCDHIGGQCLRPRKAFGNQLVDALGVVGAARHDRADDVRLHPHVVNFGRGERVLFGGGFECIQRGERGCRALQQHVRPCGHELQPGTAGGDV